MSRRPVAAAVVAGAALLVSAAPAGAATPKKTIRVYDDYFAPDYAKVKRGTLVVWRWPGFEEAGGVHDVKLKSAPRGVKKFHSEAASAEYTFKRKLTVPGAYKLVCTYHAEMRMTIRVRR